jgi:hypothetical protein
LADVQVVLSFPQVEAFARPRTCCANMREKREKRDKTIGLHKIE